MKGIIQSIFQEYGNEFIRLNHELLTSQHLKVIHAIQTCSTAQAGWMVFNCSKCAQTHYVEKSCGNRMCPTCQTKKTQLWLDKRLAGRLPIHYFMITFTLPEQFRQLAMHEPGEVYKTMFEAGSKALKKLALDPRHIGVDLSGFFGILHTWGRTVQFNPHIHFIVPGGGIDRESGLWKSSRVDFYVPAQALAKVYQGIFHQQMAERGLLHYVDPQVWRTRWGVDAQAIGHNHEGAVKYLAGYVFRTAISDSRVIGCSKGTVKFTYIKSSSRRKRTMTLPVMEFIRRYLQHVLPHGFMRIRYYGFMSSGCRIKQDRLVALVRLAQAFEVEPPVHNPEPVQPFNCPKCGGKLIFSRILKPGPRPVVCALGQYHKQE